MYLRSKPLKQEALALKTNYSSRNLLPTTFSTAHSFTICSCPEALVLWAFICFPQTFLGGAVQSVEFDPHQGSKPRPTLEAKSLNLWTARKSKLSQTLVYLGHFMANLTACLYSLWILGLTALTFLLLVLFFSSSFYWSMYLATTES